MAVIEIDMAQVHRLLAVRFAAISYAGSETRQATEEQPEDSNYITAQLLDPTYSGASVPPYNGQKDEVAVTVPVVLIRPAETASGNALYKLAASASETRNGMCGTDIDDVSTTGHYVRWTSWRFGTFSDEEDRRLTHGLLELEAIVTRFSGSDVNP